jgi:hypothetical protein
MDQNGAPLIDKISFEEPASSSDRDIAAACTHLRAAEKLLLNPTPGAIENAGLVLEEVLSSMQTWRNADNTALDSLTEFHELCRRVKALLEGALRVQWTYIHRISSATQTYSPSPVAKTWIPRVWNLSIHA